MFASVPFQSNKASQGTTPSTFCFPPSPINIPPDFSPSAKLKHFTQSKGVAGFPSRHKEHPSLTGWSQNNSLNASGIIGGESFRHNNQAPPARQSEINLDSQTEKQKDNSLEIMLPELKENPVERPSIPEPKRIEIVPEAIKEESVPQSRKRSRDVLMKNTKSPTTTVTSKPSPIIKSQKSADFNNTGLQFFHTTRTMEFPLSIPASPGSHKNVIKERTQSPTAFHRTSSPMSRTSYSKLLADPLRTTQDFKIFRMGKLKMDSSNNGAERRSATVLKARPHQQTLYIPNTVLSGSKLVKYEDPAKQKNLRLTKGLSLWSQTTPQNNTMGESTIGLKYSEPLSLESPGIRTFSQTPVGIITTKVFNFMGDKLDKEDNDIKLGLLPKFKTTIKVKRPVEEDKSELELSNPPSKFEAWRMRQTSPLKFFTSTKDMDSSNGFKRKYSRNLQQRSELKRRPTNDTFKDDTEITAQDIPVTAKEGKESEKDSTLEVNVGKKNTQRVMDKVAKIIKKRSIEVKDIIFEGDHDGKKPKKPLEPKFVKIEAKIEIDGKSIKRSGKNVRIGSSSVELNKGIKDLLEVRADAYKLESIKNFKLFESKP